MNVLELRSRRVSRRSAGSAATADPYRCAPLVSSLQRVLRAAAPLVCAALFGCGSDGTGSPGVTPAPPEHEGRYGIYRLDPAGGTVEMVYSSGNSLHRVHENPAGTKLVFQEDFGDDTFTDSEICLVNTDGSGYERLTDNGWLDAYPSWSPDGSEILFLSWPDYPEKTMDVFLMDAVGENVVELYDSGYHDGDCSWTGSKIVFTRESRIWIMDDDGTGARQVTDYERAGQQGNADLPFGDYDPRLDPSGAVICFDRMVDDRSTSGNYDFYTIGADGTEESAITDTGWQQFMAEWSHSGDRLLFTVAAMGGGGVYDMYTMSPDGSSLADVTPAGWPSEFLCSHGAFSNDDTKIYFVGEWWEAQARESSREGCGGTGGRLAPGTITVEGLK
jgi:Tol biopolymer transport system component